MDGADLSRLSGRRVQFEGLIAGEAEKTKFVEGEVVGSFISQVHGGNERFVKLIVELEDPGGVMVEVQMTQCKFKLVEDARRGVCRGGRG